MDDVDELARTEADLERRSIEVGLGIVGSEHDDDEIDRLMAGQCCGQVVRAVELRIARIFDVGGPAAQSFDDELVVVTKRVRHHGGPAVFVGMAFCRHDGIGWRPAFPRVQPTAICRRDQG